MSTAVKRFGVAGIVVLVVAAYVASVVLYAQSDAVRTPPDSQAEGDQTTVTLTVEEVQSNNSVLVANLAMSPGPALLDPQTHHLKEDLSLRVRSAAQPTRRTWSKGMLPGVFPVPLTLAGQSNEWPFDHYHSGPVEVEIFHNAELMGEPERVPLNIVDHLSGWELASHKAGGYAPYRLQVKRTSATATFAIVIVGVLMTLGALALFVAIQTLRDRRKFQPPMTTWYAAMLFAVVPLRNALPGSPPFGAWIDITVVLWVILALVVSMVIYVCCWWRHLKPDPPPSS